MSEGSSGFHRRTHNPRRWKSRRSAHDLVIGGSPKKSTRGCANRGSRRVQALPHPAARLELLDVAGDLLLGRARANDASLDKITNPLVREPGTPQQIG